MSEHEELNGLLRTAPTYKYATASVSQAQPIGPPMEAPMRNLVQWATDGSRRFVPTASTVERLPPGMYSVEHSPEVGIFFHRVETKTEGLLRLPHTNSERVLSEIQTFWDRRDKFDEYGLAQKRGIMLWGPPGSGKSCTIQLVMRDVIERGGIGMIFTFPPLFIAGMRILREIQPQTPVVALMEDIEVIIRSNDESQVLNVLDGAERMDKVVFLASTNYPEMLGPRIINRPSRFDRRFKIDHPNEASREVYLRHLIGPRSAEMDMAKWVSDSVGMSLAHLRELFVAVVILGHNYSETIEALRSMKEKLSSDGDHPRMGSALFGGTE